MNEAHYCSKCWGTGDWYRQYRQRCGHALRGQSYQHPSKAKSDQSRALVQAFVSCNNPGGNTPNATTEAGTVPTCYPAETFTSAGPLPAARLDLGSEVQG